MQLDLFSIPAVLYEAPIEEPTPHREPNEPLAPSTTPAPSLEPRAAVFVRHHRARRYIVRVKNDGSVRVTIPNRGSRREAEAFLAQQTPWVERQLRRIAGADAAAKAAIPDEELRRHKTVAKDILPKRLLELAAQHGLTVSRVSIRNQQWRWGSCSRTGHICLNWRLVTMPDWVRDYVLIHELMHLKVMDHSPKFWTLVAAVCPNYRDARAWLRREGAAL